MSLITCYNQTKSDIFNTSIEPSLDEGSFSMNDLILNISFSSVVTEIPTRAFEHCTNITKIDFSMCKNLSNIDERAFNGCISLKELDLSQTNVNMIGSKAFKDCTDLTCIKLPSTLETIERKAFKNCSNLSKLNFDDVQNINDYAFANCDNITKLDFNSCRSLQNIGTQAFINTSKLKSLIISSTNLNLGDYAFNCSNLNKLILEHIAGIRLSEQSFYNIDSDCRILISDDDNLIEILENDMLDNFNIINKCYNDDIENDNNKFVNN